MNAAARAPGRVLFYSHDTYGLGHLRRCTALAERLAADAPGTESLIVTGSPRAQSFDLVAGVDVLKLPSVWKKQDGGYAPRTLGSDLAATLDLRAALLKTAALSFRPHVVVVDHAPVGLQGELNATFDALSALPTKPKFVLGLRDVVDEVEDVKLQWRRGDVWRRIDGLYDRVLVYGDRAVRTTADEIGLPERVGDRLVFTGYVTRPPEPRPDRDYGAPLVLVCAGGGGDGADLFRAYARFLASGAATTSFRSIVVTGPLLSAEKSADLRDRFARTGAPVDVVEFTEDFGALLARAKAVVAMAGYNTAVEALASGAPTMLAPRTTPRREQEIRAARLTAVVPQFRCVPVAKLTPEVLASFVKWATLTAPPAAPCKLSLDGAAVAAREISALIAEAKAPPASAPAAAKSRVPSSGRPT